MSPFSYLKDLLVTKTKLESFEHYLPYLINRWCSFLNPTIAQEINKANAQILLENKDMHYKLLFVMFPKLKSVPRVDYIKKAKENIESTQEDKKIVRIANNKEISTREVKYLLAQV